MMLTLTLDSSAILALLEADATAEVNHPLLTNYRLLMVLGLATCSQQLLEWELPPTSL